MDTKVPRTWDITGFHFTQECHQMMEVDRLYIFDYIESTVYTVYFFLMDARLPCPIKS